MAVGPAFTIVSYPEKVQVEPEKQFDIKVSVKNTGDLGGTCLVRILDHENNEVQSQSKTIGAGDTETFVFTATAPKDYGTYKWKINAYYLSDQGEELHDSKEFTVEVVNPLTLMINNFMSVMINLMVLMVFMSLMTSVMKSIETALPEEEEKKYPYVPPPPTAPARPVAPAPAPTYVSVPPEIEQMIQEAIEEELASREWLEEAVKRRLLSKPEFRRWLEEQRRS